MERFFRSIPAPQGPLQWPVIHPFTHQWGLPPCKSLPIPFGAIEGSVSCTVAPRTRTLQGRNRWWVFSRMWWELWSQMGSQNNIRWQYLLMNQHGAVQQRPPWALFLFVTASQGGTCGNNKERPNQWWLLKRKCLRRVNVFIEVDKLPHQILNVANYHGVSFLSQKLQRHGEFGANIK